jgi:oligopeptide/dipeptide ABC transporter ATP-binding protein
MYAGRIVETAPAARLFAQPLHPYTTGLLAASLGFEEDTGPLTDIPGQPPDLASLGAGCAFAPRCQRADARCRAEAPMLLGEGDRTVACHHAVA